MKKVIGRPKGGKNKKYSYEFKLRVMREYFDDHLSILEIVNKYSLAYSVFSRWKKYYQEGILETGRIHNRGNKFSALHTSKHLSNEQKLELENMKLKVENERLKKGYTVKGSGADKEYVSIFIQNTRSLKN